MKDSDFLVSLQGKVAIVTGAKGDIGKSISLLLAKSGADVVITDIHSGQAQLSAVAKKIRKMGVRCEVVTADISNSDDVDHLLGEVLNGFGAIDLLINVTGIYISNSILDFSEVERNALIDVNIKGVFLTCQAVAKIMIQQKSGNIITIASDSAINVAEGEGPYCESKSGVVEFTKHLAKELGRYGIRVNAIEPGWIRTDMTEFVWADPAKLKVAESEIYLGYMAQPEEIGSVTLFLASNASRYITGQLLVVNGGRI
jgi:3-oxoacyl-[acyl-carrier protein] reductase